HMSSSCRPGSGRRSYPGLSVWLRPTAFLLYTRDRLFPRFGAAFQDAHPSNPLGLQEQRRTGAGGFVRSTTKQDNAAVAWNLPASGVELLGGQPNGSRYARRVFRQAAAQVHDHQVLAGAQLFLQLIRRHTIPSQALQEEAPLGVLPANP